jgi:hypothetical protein
VFSESAGTARPLVGGTRIWDERRVWRGDSRRSSARRNRRWQILVLLRPPQRPLRPCVFRAGSLLSDLVGPSSVDHCRSDRAWLREAAHRSSHETAGRCFHSADQHGYHAGHFLYRSYRHRQHAGHQEGRKYLLYIKEEIILTLAISSSESALPTLMEKMEQLGRSKALVGLVVPAGYTLIPMAAAFR